MSLEELCRRVFPDGERTALELKLVQDVYARAAATGVRSVRPEVIRRLLIHAPQVVSGGLGRVSISDANVVGALDLRGLRLDYALAFENSRFCSLELADMRVVSLDIAGGSAREITAGRLEVSHDLVIGKGFSCGGLHLMSATIGGDLNLGGAQLCHQPKRSSLNFDGARIGARVYLRKSNGHDFVATGRVSGQNARVEAGILCNDAEFRSHLILTRCQVRGEVSLKDATVCGELQMSAMAISSDLKLEGTTVAGAEANFSRAQIGGSFVWKTATDDRDGCDTARLTVNLTQARMGYLDDRFASWAGVTLEMDGLSLDGIAAQSTEEYVCRRREWLGAQRDWSPHPYDQVRAALLDSGHESAARKIALARERARRKRGGLSWLGKKVHGLYGLILGYGYRPLRFFIVSAVIIALFWVPFSRLHDCPSGTRGRCKDFVVRKAEASDFSAAVYSADAFLPVDLKQTADWNPRRHVFQLLVASEAVLGWLMAGLLVGAVTGVLRRD